MRRRWNILIWAGFGIVLLALVSYLPLFARFPLTNDVPWVNLLLFLAGGCSLVFGLKRAFREPRLYRGKVSGPILSVVSVLAIGLFCFGVFVAARNIPSAVGAPHAGQPAPSFVLASADGKQVALADLLRGNRGALLIFYRGYW